ncbi:hypothetical protein EDB85DRAFT_865742 [Lactarius pseudohatsudake]|nr:hypothetical protein EDB85DRAFT_865742 [Lactarius pseudohatsudake]
MDTGPVCALCLQFYSTRPRPGSADHWHVHRAKGRLGPSSSSTIPTPKGAQVIPMSPRRRCGAASAAWHLPMAIDGDGGVEGEDAMATFEKRRQRESRRKKNGKQKVAKGGGLSMSSSSPSSCFFPHGTPSTRRRKEDVRRGFVFRPPVCAL